MGKAKLFSAISSVRNYIILAVLTLTVLFTPPIAERYGDRLQVALPLLGLGCAVVTGGAGEYLVRFLVLEIAIHGPKNALGDLPINQRPWGGNKGFPSGHSASAAFGASALVHECVQKSPFVKGAVIIAAGFVGTSRVESGAHNIWQVLAGILTGWGIERLLRRNTPARRRVLAGLSTFWGRFRKNGTDPDIE
ncbi:MAG: phosphatase PAP2 family protein [Rhodobacteraceae bacterium]|nr:phosphatase PAP2 family protein [Paracoccaceae bacterium]